MRIRKINPTSKYDTASQLAPEDLVALERLRALLANLPDPRMSGKVCFQLPEILIIALCALISGCDHFTEMAAFANTQKDWLQTFLSLPNGVPSHDVFRNAFMIVKPQAILDILALWSGSTDGQHLIIDGKCLRGTKQGNQGVAKVYLLRAWVKQQGLTIAQVPCAEKSNEAATLPQLFERLNLTGTVVSIDAMGTCPDTAQAVVEGGGDYVLCLKANQPQAFKEVQEYYNSLGKIAPETATAPLPPVPPNHDRFETAEHSHGRYEQRVVTTTGELSWFTRDWKWRGLKSITEVRRLSHRNGKREALSEEVHYYISSLEPDAKTLGKFIRDHWMVENACHYVLDVVYGEDHCQVQEAQAAQNLSLFREVATKVLKAVAPKESIAHKRKWACLDPKFRLKAILTGIRSLFQA